MVLYVILSLPHSESIPIENLYLLLLH